MQNAKWRQFKVYTVYISRKGQKALNKLNMGQKLD